MEEPVEILDREIKKLKRSKIPIVKVRWNSKRGPEFTSEREDHMKTNTCTRLVIEVLTVVPTEFRDEILPTWGYCDIRHQIRLDKFVS